MAARNLPRENSYTTETSPASHVSIEWTLPTDLLLEIIARSDICSLVRCAASSKFLRHNILSPPFIRRVTQQGGIVPPCIVAYLSTHNDEARLPPPLSLVHPATPTAASYLNDHLSPYLSRYADDLLGGYIPVTSRGGLVLFRRRHVKRDLSNLCVYDTITGHRTFLSNPPGITLKQTGCFDKFVLLTAADGIGCSFLLFVPHRRIVQDSNIRRTTLVKATTWARGTWAPTITSNTKSGFFSQHCHATRDNTAILQGGVIHWLVLHCDKIVSYNVCTREQGIIKLPGHLTASKGVYQLGSYYSLEGHNLLRLLVVYGFKISLWHQLPGGDWASEAVMIDMEEKLRSLDPDIPAFQHVHTGFKCSCEGSNVLLLYMDIYSPTLQTGLRTLLIILDLEMKEMRIQDYSTSWSVLLEFDLPSRLLAMKIIP